MLESPIRLAPGARDFNSVQRRTRNFDRPCSFRPRDRPYSREGVRGLVFFEKRRGAAGLTGPLVHSAVMIKLDSDYSASVMGTQNFFPYLALS